MLFLVVLMTVMMSILASLHRGHVFLISVLSNFKLCGVDFFISAGFFRYCLDPFNVNNY